MLNVLYWRGLLVPPAWNNKLMLFFAQLILVQFTAAVQIPSLFWNKVARTQADIHRITPDSIEISYPWFMLREQCLKVIANHQFRQAQSSS